MANYTGSDTSGNAGDSLQSNPQDPVNRGLAKGKPMVAGRKLFMTKNPGAPGKLGKSSTKAESLSKLRGKGALA
jgi:hypothetical protein